ncbi:hypothetical protein CF327_g2205 [Tilletia walkeri]|uniref:DUF726-domain-containing protein n=1 Tax=Tilletia walkeri TaxID=117179 RepID=A0A8X7N9B9_9BASI|nr:hypothetical protein CF327_g2205 [Tilletia walkeri]KAE8269572.1 hypothetical protein A4X09_0g2782 [Tilletia walkeri]
MASSSTSRKASTGSLDLSSLESHAGSWSADLRWAVAIAVAYAAQRCLLRVQVTSATGSDTDTVQSQPNTLPLSRRLQEDWQTYGDNFVQATCQHLGLDASALPPGPLTIEDVLSAAHGRIMDEEEYDIFHHTVVQPHEASLEQGISLEREITARQAVLRKIRRQQEEERGELAHDADEDAVELSWAHVSEAAAKHRRRFMKMQAVLHLKRRGGPLTEHGDQEASHSQTHAEQIPHELLLIALGLGRYRDEHTSGSEPLFEGEAAFGSAELDHTGAEKANAFDSSEIDRVAAEKAQVEQEKELVQKELEELRIAQGPAKTAQAQKVQPERRPIPPVPEPAPAQEYPGQADSGSTDNQPFAQAGAAFGKAWSSFAKGASTFAANTAAAAKNATQQTFPPQSSSGAPTPPEDKSEAGEKQAIKPNEPFHFDSRARAIIFVAFLALGGEAVDIWRAEKVIAQTIYFILSSARANQDEQGKQDPLAAGGGANDRTESMNQGSATSIAREKLRSSTWAKKAAIGAGFAVGGVVVGLTGGLAAPLIAPALAGLTGMAFLSSAGGVLALGTLLGLGGGGLAGYRVRRRLMGVDSFTFVEVGEGAKIKKELEEGGMSGGSGGLASLHATIAVPGLCLTEGSGIKMWDRVFSHTPRIGSAKPDGRDVFACVFEQKLMSEAGEGLYSFVRSTAIKQVGTRAATEIIKTTAMAGLVAITLPLAVVNTTSMALDGLFARAKTRCARAGLVLAETLIEERQGHRPAILIGHSVGCVTIMEALLELSRRAEGQTCASDNAPPSKDGSALPTVTSTGKVPANLSHIVDSVYLISAPCRYSSQDWARARRVVARRFVNAYSKNDLVSSIATILGDGVTLRGIAQGSLTKDVGVQAAGSVGVGQEISERDGIEDVDVSDIIIGHFDGVVDPPDRQAAEPRDRLCEVIQRLGVLDN